MTTEPTAAPGPSHFGSGIMDELAAELAIEPLELA